MTLRSRVWAFLLSIDVSGNNAFQWTYAPMNLDKLRLKANKWNVLHFIYSFMCVYYYRHHVCCRNSCSLLLTSFSVCFCYQVLKRGCLTCIRWFCPFTLYQNKSPGPSIHKCCCYGYNIDRSVCYSWYELKQFSDPVVPKACRIQKCVSFFFRESLLQYNFLPQSFNRHEERICLFHAYRFVLNLYVCTQVGLEIDLF